jgi:hypothetical protein
MAYGKIMKRAGISAPTPSSIVNQAASSLDPGRMAPRGTGTTLGRVAGGVLGAATGGVLGGAVGQNFGRMIGGGTPGIKALMKGKVFGNAGKAPPAPPAPEAAGAGSGMPQLSAYKPLTGADIQKEFESSPWMKMATERQQAEQALRLNQAGQQAGTQAAMAQANLAARGGLRGGAAERLAGTSAENAIMAGQGIRGQGAAERGQLGMQGLGIAAQTVGQNVAGENERNMMQYQEQMKQLGAGATAEAIKRSGGGGGFFQNPAKAVSGWFK